MILQELYQLYERLVASGADVPLMGTSVQKVTFCVELTPDGGCTFRDLRQCVESPPDRKGMTKKKTVATDMIVLGGGKKTGKGLKPCFLSNTVDYLLGCIEKKTSDEKKLEARKKFTETQKRYLNLRGSGLGAEYEALCRFYEAWVPPANLDELPCELSVREAMKTGRGVFRMQGEMRYLHQIPEIRNWWLSHGDEQWLGNPRQAAEDSMMCLITGKEGKVARLHEPSISGVGKDKAMLASFNKTSFCSYGKIQGSNSPVSESAAFGYCNALNYLLRSSNHRIQLGDATTVFWTDAPQDSAGGWNQLLGYSFSGPPQAQDGALLREMGALMKKIVSGQPTPPPEANEVRFFLLGLAATNKARLSVRFFLTGTMGDYIRRLAEHFDALRLQPRNEKFNDPEIIMPWMILRETVRDSKDDIPSTYIEPLMRAILLGRPYPDSLAMAMLRRMKYKPKPRKETIKGNNGINYIRCAYLKAWLTRKHSSYKLTPMLDENNTQPGYVLGRLFALLHKTQDADRRNLNRSICDAYYASASTSPACVFPRLLRLYRHHVIKLDVGLRIIREKEIQAVMSLLSGFPAHLNFEQQGLFALGFYHQTQAFFTPKNNPDNQ